MNTSKSEKDNLRLLLKAQYGHVEAYCNAQTMLQNELVDSRHGRSHLLHQHSLQQATLCLSNCISDVQEDLRTMVACTLSDRNQQKALDAHVQRFIRVLETIYHNGGRFHSNGIPASSDNHDTKTVALATLRASIAQLETALDMS